MAVCDPPALVKPKPYMAMWLWLWCVGGDFQCPAGSGPQPHARSTHDRPTAVYLVPRKVLPDNSGDVPGS